MEKAGIRSVFIIGFFIFVIAGCSQIEKKESEAAVAKQYTFKYFSTGNIDILLPDSLLERHDLIFSKKDSSEVVAVRTTVGGQFNKEGKIFSYGLVETKYIKDTGIYKTFKIDSIKNNLLKNLNAQPEFKLTGMGVSKFRGLDVIVYKGWSKNYFIKSVHLPYKYYEFNISYGGTDSVETDLDKIMNSIKFKQ